MKKKQTELLAPAGSMESFYAAVNSGADSVYLGGKSFNARQNSQNFSNMEIKHIIKYAHNKNVKIYVTLNILLKDSEITDVLNYAIFLYNNDVDSVIVQDLGLFYLLKRYLSDLPVNISTQAVIYDEFGVEFFKKNNADKIIMARELSLEQLKYIEDNTDADLEVFVHGALCTCYSGQCYMSSFLGGRSGNRGKCAQPCRLNYSFYDKTKDIQLKKFEVSPILSLKDVMVGDNIYSLMDAGIKTFKIEGRMKGPEYTASAVEYYRNLIDGHDDDKKPDLKKLERKLISTFSRGHTNGYLNPRPEDEMYAGTSSGFTGENIDNIADEVKEKAIEFSLFRRNKIDFDICLKIDDKAVVNAYDGKNKVEIFSDEVCESSIKNQVTDEIIEGQLSKLGNTIYKLNRLNIVMDNDIFIKKSTLNKMRRDATDKLFELGSKKYNRDKTAEKSQDDIFGIGICKKKVNPKISLKINSNDEFYLIDSVKVKRVYVPYNLDLNKLGKIKSVEKYLWIPSIVSKLQYDEFKKNIKLYEKIFEGVCVNNPGSLHFFKEKSKLKIHCGMFFNIINTFSVKMLKENGADSFTFSVESNIRDMENINKYTDISSELAAHVYVKLMTMKNCPMSTIKNCKNADDCSKCDFRNNYQLLDRKGVRFNIERENRLTNIYNSVPLTILEKAEDFIRSGVEYFCIDSKYEENAEEIIDALYCEINGIKTVNILKENSFTRGHYLKNIL